MYKSSDLIIIHLVKYIYTQCLSNLVFFVLASDFNVSLRLDAKVIKKAEQPHLHEDLAENWKIMATLTPDRFFC